MFALKRNMPAGILITFLLMAGTLILPLSVPAQGLTRITISEDITEELEDPDSDGLFDNLVLIIRIKVFEPGSYGIFGSIGQGDVNANWGPEDLALGEKELELVFSGGQISQYGKEERFVVKLEAYSRDLEMDPVTEVYITERLYDSSKFEAPQGARETFVYAKGDSVVIQGSTMSVYVNQTRPELSFSYSGNYASSISRTSILYEKIIAFDDMDGNGKWDQGQDTKVYEGDLTTVDWELDLNVDVGYEIILSGILQMRRVDTATVAGWTRITFRLSSDLLGSSGNIQKFDIDIELWQPLDAERLALMHSMTDTTGMQTIQAGDQELDYIDDPYQLNTLGSKGEVFGIYSWGEEIKVGLLDPDTESNATTWYVIEGGGSEIWFSYPIDDDILFIHHDPKMGMDPANIPVKEEGDDSLDNNLWIMLIGTLIGIVLVGLTIFIQVRRREPGGGA